MPACELGPGGPSRRGAVAPATLWRYGTTVLPCARRELRRWKRRAGAIPDPALRAHARATLRDEGANAEGAALLALAAPRLRRTAVVRLLVAVQVLYDYLDTLSEQPAEDPLAASRRLHGALLAALADAAAADWYAGYGRRDDGGYLAALVAHCRTLRASLPAGALVAGGVRRAAERASECQSRNHAAMLGALPLAAFAQWAGALPAGAGPKLRWWELAAAAGSSLALHALLAAAADARLTPAAAAQIEAAYWPWVCGLNTLLESVADAPADARSGNHSYVGRYRTPQDAAGRLAAIAAQASAAVRELPGATHHATVLAAMTSFYLEAGSARPNAALRRGVLAQLDLGTSPVRVALRLRRRLG